jgi:hypothetical protein
MLNVRVGDRSVRLSGTFDDKGVTGTAGVLTILGTVRHRPAWVAPSVALYITAAYWFTSSTGFANPAITLARSLSDTFAGVLGDWKRARGRANEQQRCDEGGGDCGGRLADGTEHLKNSLYVVGAPSGPMPSTLQKACQTKKSFVFSRQRFSST